MSPIYFINSCNYKGAANTSFEQESRLQTRIVSEIGRNCDDDYAISRLNSGRLSHSRTPAMAGESCLPAQMPHVVVRMFISP